MLEGISTIIGYSPLFLLTAPNAPGNGLPAIETQKSTPSTPLQMASRQPQETHRLA